MDSARSKAAILIAVLAGISCGAFAASYLTGAEMWPTGPSGKRDDSDLSLNITNDSVCFESAKYKFQECSKVVVDGGKYDVVDAKTGTINNVYEVK